MAIDVDAKAILEESWRVPLGYVKGATGEVIIGLNPDVDHATLPEAIWSGGGLYTGFPAVAQPLRVTSSDATDTSAGVGARTVLLRGLDNNFNRITETVTLNGLTPVVTTNSFRRCHRMQVTSSGASGSNVGTITVQHNVTTANIFGVISPTDGVNKTGVYTVPAGCVALLTRIFFEVVSGTALKINLRARVQNTEAGTYVDNLVIPYYIAAVGNREKFPSFGGMVLEKTDLYFMATDTDSGAANIACVAGFDVITLDRTV